MYPTVYLLIPKNKTARKWIDNNLGGNLQKLGEGIAIEHRYIHDICNAIDNEGLREHFDLVG